MNVSFVRAGALALALLSSAAASAMTLTPAQHQTLSHNTEAYFDALTSGKTAAFNAIVTPNYRLVLPKGKTLSAADVLARVRTNKYGASKPYRKITIGDTTTDGVIVTEHVSTQGYTSAFFVQGQQTVSFYTQHVLSWIKGPDGVWRVDKDHVTEQNNSLGIGA
jgi:hypothetical protein